MKKCNDCEAIFGDNYIICPSCKSTSFLRYVPIAKQDMEKNEVKEIITPFVEFTPLDDFQG